MGLLRLKYGPVCVCVCARACARAYVRVCVESLNILADATIINVIVVVI